MPPEAALLATAVAASLGFGIERAVAIDRAHPAGAPAWWMLSARRGSPPGRCCQPKPRREAPQHTPPLPRNRALDPGPT